MYVLGIDIGSGFSKAVVLEGKALCAFAVMPSGGGYKETARKIADDALVKCGLSLTDISYTLSTGYGASAVDFADQSATDISCHAFAINHLFRTVGTVVDIGAQFSKVIRVDESGKVTHFILNEKCAGGSGRFLQIIARMLHVNFEEIGELSLKAQKPVEFTTGCAVFAESEAVSRVAEGARIEDILAGIHKAMASKIVNLVVRTGLVQDCAVTGGGAKDIGLVRSLEAELGTVVLVPEQPQITAAYGAALVAGLSEGRPSSFL
jgi:predicted CoA-substrate-specific enzyme activase